jgi:cytochrome P450 family 628
VGLAQNVRALFSFTDHIGPSTDSKLIALRDYEPRVAKYTEQLLQQLESRVGEPLNMTQWIGFYGFDVMGDLAFGQSFDMLKSGTVNYYIGLMQDHLKVRFAFGRIPWAFRILQALASLNASASRFHAWIEDQVKNRVEVCVITGLSPLT